MKAEITKDNIDRAKKLLDALQSTVKIVGELSEENFYLKAKITKATEKDTEGFDKEFEKFCYDSLSVLTNDPTKQLGLLVLHLVFCHLLGKNNGPKGGKRRIMLRRLLTLSTVKVSLML